MLAPRGRVPSIALLAPIFAELAMEAFIRQFKLGFKGGTPKPELLAKINRIFDVQPYLGQHLNEEYRDKAAGMCWMLSQTIFHSRIYRQAWREIAAGHKPTFDRKNEGAEKIFRDDIEKLAVQVMRQAGL